MPFERAFEAIVESEDIVLQSGAVIKIYWSPQSIFPLVNHSSYTVDINLRLLDLETNEWKTIATLASALTNNGIAEVTIPKIQELETYEHPAYPVVIEVGVSTASTAITQKRDITSNILNKIGRAALHITKKTAMRLIFSNVLIVGVSAIQRLKCEEWALYEQENIGQKIETRVRKCPCTAEQARRDEQRFKPDDTPSSESNIIKEIQDFFGIKIIDDLWRNFFHPGTEICYREINNDL